MWPGEIKGLIRSMRSGHRKGGGRILIPNAVVFRDSEKDVFFHSKLLKYATSNDLMVAIPDIFFAHTCAISTFDRESCTSYTAA